MLKSLRTIVAIIVAKLAKKSSQLLGKGGGNIPGVVARKIDRSILKTLSEQVDKTIIITGTNGKTTASNLMGAILTASGEAIIHNKEGNNLLTGITASFVNQAKWTGKLNNNYRYAVLEVDEANVPLVLQELSPSYVIVNNFFEDQLDRVGELKDLIDKVKNAIEKTNATLVLNGDDPLVMQMSLLPNDKIYFGVHQNAYSFQSYANQVASFCPVCAKELHYSHKHYGHLGHYECECGFRRPKMDVETRAMFDDMNFHISDEQYQLQIDGVYNIYNALGPIALAKAEGFSQKQISTGLQSFTSLDGRMQTYTINGADRLVNLVKNAAGLDISLSEALKHEEEKQIVIFLNDLAHDAQDISWIWDTNLERIKDANVTRVICSGIRALDMAVRMKYAGIDEDKLVIEESVEKAIDEALKYREKTFFFPTYTALNTVNKILDTKNEQRSHEKEVTRG